MTRVGVMGLLVCAALCVPGAQAAEPDAVKKLFTKVVGAIEAGDRKEFVVDATDAVKEGTTDKIMESLNKQIGTRLKAGYDATYLCELKQAGYQVYLWKVTFKDKGDDVVVRMAINKDGKLAGFFLQ